MNRTLWNGSPGGEPAGWTSNIPAQAGSMACGDGNGAAFIQNSASRMIYFNAQASVLIMKLREDPTMGNSFLYVEESDDGVFNWNLIGAYGLGVGGQAVTSCNDIVIPLNPGTRYVQWTFGKDIGNYYLDDVRILGAPRFYRANSSGDWNGPATWAASSDNVTFSPTSLPPTSNDHSVNIMSGQVVTISGSGVSFKNTIVENGGTLRLTTPDTYTIGGSGTNLTINNGGKLGLNFGTVTAPSGTGTARVKTGGMVEANTAISGSLLGDAYLNVNSKFTYEHGAIFDWKINSTTLSSGSSQNYFKTDAATDIPIFRISVTPGPFGSSSDNIFNAILEANAPFDFTGTGKKTFRGGIIGTSIVNLTSSGPVVLPNPSSLLGGSVTINMAFTNGLQLPLGAIVPVGANVKILGPEDANINKVSGSLTVEGILDVAGLQITNGGMSEIRVTGTGTFKTSNLDGFSGTGASIALGTIVNLLPGSTVELNRADGLTQNLTSRSDFKNIRFSGSGLKIPSSAFSPVGNLIITGSAILDCTGKNVGSSSTGLVMDGGRLIVSTGGQQPSMDSTYNLTGGTIEFNGTSNETIKPKDGFGTNIIYKNIEVTGTDVRMSNANINLGTAGTFTVKNNGVFTINDNTITGPAGSQTVTIENGGLFKSGNNEGFHGYIATFSNNSSLHQNIENIVLQPSSTVEYSRNGDQPITNAGGIQYGNITLSGSPGTKTAPVSNLVINGNLVNVNSLFAHNSGTITFGGSVAQAYSSPSALTMYDVNNNNTVGLNINSDLKIASSLTLGTNAKLNVLDTINLLSDAVKTARVGQIPATASITYGTGRFIVDRFIPLHPKAWQFLSTPVRPEQTVNAAWQEGNPPLVNGLPGYGTIITGPGSGFDISTVNPSMKSWDAGPSLWAGIPNTSQLISNSKGYMLFVRGDRGAQTFNAPATATILRTTGKIHAPGSDAPSSIAVTPGRFESIGNPYVSAIDLTQVNRLGDVQDIFYVWDPKLTTGPTSAFGLGGFRTLTRNGATYDVTPPGGSFGNTTKYIQSGQAFFVHSVSAAGTVTFDENDKADNNVLVNRGAEPIDGRRLYASLYVKSGEDILLDGVQSQFEPGYSAQADALDAIKLNSPGENISILSDQVQMVVERRSLLKRYDTIFYNLTQLRQQSYSLQFVPHSMQMGGVTAYLVDRYQNIHTAISMEEPSGFDFKVTADPLSAAANRFFLVFGRIPKAGIEITAKAGDDGVNVGWSISEERGIGNYTVERSHDGISFSSISSHQPSDNNGNSTMYATIDRSPLPTGYYRIRVTENNGEVTFSRIVKVVQAQQEPMFTVYPNPVTGNILRLQFRNHPSGSYMVRMNNAIGQVVHVSQIQLSGADETKAIPVNVAAGIYQLQISGAGSTTTSDRVIIK